MQKRDQGFLQIIKPHESSMVAIENHWLWLKCLLTRIDLKSSSSRTVTSKNKFNSRWSWWGKQRWSFFRSRPGEKWANNYHGLPVQARSFLLELSSSLNCGKGLKDQKVGNKFTIKILVIKWYYWTFIFSWFWSDMMKTHLFWIKLIFFFQSGSLVVLYPYLVIHMRSLGLSVEEVIIIFA